MAVLLHSKFRFWICQNLRIQRNVLGAITTRLAGVCCWMLRRALWHEKRTKTLKCFPFKVILEIWRSVLWHSVHTVSLISARCLCVCRGRGSFRCPPSPRYPCIFLSAWKLRQVFLCFSKPHFIFLVFAKYFSFKWVIFVTYIYLKRKMLRTKMAA